MSSRWDSGNIQVTTRSRCTLINCVTHTCICRIQRQTSGDHRTPTCHSKCVFSPSVSLTGPEQNFRGDTDQNQSPAPPLSSSWTLTVSLHREDNKPNRSDISLLFRASLSSNMGSRCQCWERNLSFSLHTVFILRTKLLDRTR